MKSEWKEVRLEDITSKIGDGLHGTPKYDDNGGYYFINGNNISNGKIEINDNTKRVNYEEYLKHKKELNDRTILVSINGTLGNIGLYDNEQVCLGKSACYLNIVEDVDKEFVKYILISAYFQDYIYMYATGTTIKNMGLKSMRDFTFKLPSFPVQQKIAHILSTLDDKIELNRKMNQTLEAMAQAIFKSWFVDFDLFKEGEFVESELGMIPKGWEVKKLSEVLQVNPSYALKKGTLAKYVELSNLSTTLLSIDGYKYREFTGGGAKFKNGDTILVRITPSLENGKRAFVDFLNEDEIGWGSTEYIILSGTKELQEWSYLLSISDTFRNYAISNMNGSSGRQRVPNDAVKEYKIAVPKNGIFIMFSQVINLLFRNIKSNADQMQTLQKTRDTLLPKLLSGEVEV